MKTFEMPPEATFKAWAVTVKFPEKNLTIEEIAETIRAQGLPCVVAGTHSIQVDRPAIVHEKVLGGRWK